MKYKICLSKNIVIFYMLLVLPIGYGSIVNLINIINGTGSVVALGAFGLGGFILLPLMIWGSYRNNLCKVETDGVSIGKRFYKYNRYLFSIESYDQKLVERPIISLWQKTYFKLNIKDTELQQIESSEELNIFSWERKRLEKELAI